MAAARVHDARDIKIPHLEYWNESACARHDEPTPSCEYRQCGGPLWAHQRVGMSWLYIRERGILADGTGTGKSNQVYAMLALMKQKGELTDRALIVTQTPAAGQWLQEGHRWVPKLHLEAALSGMSRKERVERYTQNWDVLIMGSHMALRDAKMLLQLAPQTLVVDDVDAILNHSNKTYRALLAVSRQARRCVVINATNVQIRLQQLHAAASFTDGMESWGTLRQFERRYVRQEPVTIYNSKTGRKTNVMQTVGYKNMREFKSRLQPMMLRRTDDQLDDVNMPVVVPPTDVWLEMHPAQRAKYEALQGSVLKLMREEGTEVKKLTALTKVGYGQRICSGLPALKEPDGPGASVKLDWVMSQLQGEWADQKIVVFIKNIGLLEALEARCASVGIGTAHIRGSGDGHPEYSRAAYRAEEIRRFWDDPTCRVMLGTSAIERSLNLQVSNKIVFVDLHLNPSRVFQIVGRVKRGGSKFKHIYVYNLLCVDSQEEKYKPVLETRQALIDYVYGEENELFEQLSATQLLELIRP